MIQNPVQFAVVREDPEIEAELIQKYNAKSVLMIASGGCTAFSLLSRFPGLQLSLFDMNPNQLDLVNQKKSTLTQKNYDPFTWNIGKENKTSLNANGNFESLFRTFRNLIHEFVCTESTWLDFFQGKIPNEEFCKNLNQNPYWKIAFELFFSDPILEAMFTSAATQHAPDGSYPKYFQNQLEAGLLREDARNNYFLHHIFLGYYLNNSTCLPYYLATPPTSLSYKTHLGALESVEEIGAYDMVGLSNIFDWSSKEQIKSIAKHLVEKLKPGSIVLYRQLGHRENFSTYFGNSFTFNQELSTHLLEKDRSLFYSNIVVGMKF